MKLYKFGWRSGLLVICFFSLVVMLASCGIGFAQIGKPSYVPNQYIIKVKAGTTKTELSQQLKTLGATIVKPVALKDTYLIKIGKSVGSKKVVSDKTSSALSSKWVIESIQPNCIYRICAVPNDEYWDQLWGMELINAPKAWDAEKGNSSVTVAVVDTGVAYDHPDLSGRCIGGYDAVDNDYDPYDEFGHGTHVAGIIGAQGDNGIGVVGVCWDNVQIMPIRVLGRDGSGTTDNIISGLDYVLNTGADVVNMSIGGYYNDPVYHSKIKELDSAGIIIVAAAGNDSWNTMYPAAWSEVIAVSAIGPDDFITYYSSYGPSNEIDIAAPGGDYSAGGDSALIWSTIGYLTFDDTGNITGKYLDYAQEQGTSMACPHVAGAAALLISAGLPAGEVRYALTQSARFPAKGYDAIKYGAGILDIGAAITNTRLKVITPSNGSNVSARPSFSISVLGIASDTIKVYIDYVDADDDGIPDNLSFEKPIIDDSNINNYYIKSKGMIYFDWPIEGKSAFEVGAHRVYVEGDPLIDGTPVEPSFSKFNVAANIFKAGIYLFSFPYLVDTTVVAPSDILTGSSFSEGSFNKSKLSRWIATPVTEDSLDIPMGYATYNPDDTSDNSWVNYQKVLDNKYVNFNGSTYYAADPLTGSKTVENAAVLGSGYWLILSQDTPIDDTLDVIDSAANVDLSKGINVALFKGWNMIGNPYAHAIAWQSVFVTYKGQTKNLVEASEVGWLRPTLFGFNSNTSKEYKKLNEKDPLETFCGYWLRALVGGVQDPLTMTMIP